MAVYNFTEDNLNDMATGLSSYASGFKGGAKHFAEIQDAYNNLIRGLKDGSITYSNGVFHDSKGRYYNNIYYNPQGTKINQNRGGLDYYGLAATYIARKLRRIPDSRIQFGNTAGTDALNSLYFRKGNTAAQNLRYFHQLDIDPSKPNSEPASYTNRLRALSDFMTTQFTDQNFDKIFANATPEQKRQFLQDTQDALQAINDGTVEGGDYQALSRVFPSLDINKLLYTGEVPYNGNEDIDSPKRRFLNYAYSTYKTDAQPFIRTIRPPALSKDNVKYLDDLVNKLDNDQLDTAFKMALDSKDKDISHSPIFGGMILPFALSPDQFLYALISKYLLRDNYKEGLYTFNFQYPKYIGLQYDPEKQELYGKNLWDIPYWQDYMYDEWTKTNPGNEHTWADRFFTEAKKHGGILKAEEGAKTPYWWQALSNAEDWTNKYERIYDTSKLINGYLEDDDEEMWVAPDSGHNIGRYSQTKNSYTPEQIQEIENSPYYKQFTEDMFDENGQLTDMGVAWAKATDALTQDKDAMIYDGDTMREQWAPQGKDLSGHTHEPYTNVKDYIVATRNDGVIGPRHNVFKATGTRYYYKDDKGDKHYVDPSLAEKYQKADTSETVTDGLTTWTDYELIGPQAQEKPIQPLPGSDVHTATGKPVETMSPTMNWPLISETARMLKAIRYNDKIKDTLLEPLKPVLMNTYELHSPVTGAFNFMQYKNSQADDLMYAATQPQTSDATLAANVQLEANKLANRERTEGKLADDAKMQQTAKEALARQEDNVKRRTDIANKNRYLINETERERAEVKAKQLEANHESIDQYMQFITKQALTDRELDKTLNANTASQEYSNMLAQYNSDYDAAHPGATPESKAADEEYQEGLRNLSKRLRYDTMRAYKGWRYNTGVPLTYNQILYGRMGAKLDQDTLSLITKVMNNEHSS